MSLLEQDIRKKKQINELSNLPELEKEFEARNNKKYEFEAIINSVM